MLHSECAPSNMPRNTGIKIYFTIIMWLTDLLTLIFTENHINKRFNGVSIGHAEYKGTSNSTGDWGDVITK